jgi:DNA polymerase-4
MTNSELTILHVDMDAFYASVEQRDRPELRGLPVVVGGSAEGRGVVCAASYEARKFGVHSAMPAITARRLCPQAIFLPLRMNYYAQISAELRQILESFTPLVQPLSLDEAFLDVRGCEGLFGHAPEIAREIRARIHNELRLTASVGVAPNKFLAKLASDLQKPDGLVVIEPERVDEILAPLPVGRLWGVGKKGEKRLHALGLHTIGQLAALPESVVQDHFGTVGSWLWRLAHGQDDGAVAPDGEAKSVSTETTFSRDIGNREVLRTCLLNLVDHLGQRLRRHGLRARTIDLKLRTSDFRTFFRSESLSEASDLTEVIWQTASSLLEKRLPNDWLPLRLLGVGATRLVRDEAVQHDLFSQAWRAKQKALEGAMDAIRDQFGRSAIRRARQIDKSADEHPLSP